MHKPNCCGCIYRRDVPGSAHSACAVLEGKAAMATAMLFLAGATALKAGNVPVLSANPHGVRMGWFMWPVDFDPVWLESCAMEEVVAKSPEAHHAA